MPSPQKLSVEDWSLDRLRADPRNPRRHPPLQIRQIAASIQEFGFINPVLVDPSGEIIAGEARWQAANAVRLKMIPVVVLSHLTATQRKAYRIADNRLPAGAVWDDQMLAEVMAELQALDFDLPTIGFDDRELAHLFDGLVPDIDPPQESPQTLPDDPVTCLGDIWIMGQHRLICGDSTKIETMDALMQSGADLVFTDPPYGMSFGKGKVAGGSAKGDTVKAHGMILGDDAQGDELVSLVGEALKCAAAAAKPDASFYVCFTWRTYAEFLQAVNGAGLQVAACIVWDKGSIGLGFQHYRPQHEFVFYCKSDRWFGGQTQSDVWQFSRGRTDAYVHPTQKPVDLVIKAITNSSLPHDVVLDLFGGSGSTLIACEQTNRQARLVELDPKYCDVIVKRWQALTGNQAVHIQAAKNDRTPDGRA